MPDAVQQFAGDHVYKVDEKVIGVLERALLPRGGDDSPQPALLVTKTPPSGNTAVVISDERDLLIRWRSYGPNGYLTGRMFIELMLKGSPDCARQRTWGVPITLFAVGSCNRIRHGAV